MGALAAEAHVIRFDTVTGMLRSLLRLLNRSIASRPGNVRASHPYFGEITLLTFKDALASYWEAEIVHQGDRLGIGINAPDGREPSESQARFAQRIVSDPNAAFARAEPLLAP
jgi:hypothetical protein